MHIYLCYIRPKTSVESKSHESKSHTSKSHESISVNHMKVNHIQLNHMSHSKNQKERENQPNCTHTK